MTIKITKRPYRLYLWVPTCCIRSKWICKKILECNYKDTLGESEKEKIIAILPVLARTLKKYIKEKGHFDLVDVKASGGGRVQIRV